MEESPKSRRYWRLNTIMALRATWASERDAVDPEDLAIIKAHNAELAQLEAIEKAVKTRYASMLAKHRQKINISP